MAQSEEPRRLFRVMKERMIAGVCSGLGYYFKVDPVLVRILFIISVFVSFGATLLVYLVLALAVPKDNGQ
ncbi:MAG: PspC domain-containing protein [Bacteroidetes bacterium]|nr:PspC domain-containing protein [Bacteroidota bacterium]